MAISNNPAVGIPATFNLHQGEPAAKTPVGTAEPAPFIKSTPTGISSVQVVDGPTASAILHVDKLVQMGLNVYKLSQAEQTYIDNLKPAQLTGLKGVANAFSAAVDANTGKPPTSNIAMPDTLQSRWADYLSTKAGDATDVNALVQWVLRESYNDTTKDLYFYAEKVKFFNNLKKAIRDEIQRARDELVKYAGKDDTTKLEPPFIPDEPATDFVGATNVNAADPGAAQAAAALAEATSSLKKNESGNGVGQVTGAALANLKPPANGTVFQTYDANGNPAYRVDHQGTEVRIYGPPDENGESPLLTRIWGDPHVDENGGGDNWHFGQDSTFILPDGSKLYLNTQETSPGVFVTVGIDILSGDQRAHSGEGIAGSNETGVFKDRAEFDAAHADTVGSSGGVFALAGGEWAIMGQDGKFHDIKDMSWEEYLQNPGVAGDAATVGVSSAQALAAQDHLGGFVSNVNTAMAEAEKHGVLKTKADLDNYIQNMEEKLNSVGDDAQLANVDLQNMLQKQQQTMQMMSNISKMLHDTAMAIIRKIGG